MKCKFMCLGSGSSGNCYYFATEQHTILIDAGLGPRIIKKILKEHGLDIHGIHAVFVTHDHADHIKAIGSLSHYHQIPIYATEKVHEGMNRSYCMTQKLNPEQVRFVEKEHPIMFSDFKITGFEVPHDSSDNVGYFIEAGTSSLLLLTDVGHISPTIARYIDKANYLILETNYDESMLENGPYPRHLKERIASDTGHLCNKAAAEHLAAHFPPGLRHLWLCHLSKDNNHPDLALKTIELALRAEGHLTHKDLPIEPLRRTVPSPLYEFDF